MIMFSKLFLKDMVERAISTGAQTLLIALGGQSADKVTDGYMVLVVAFLGGFILSVIKSLAAANLGTSNSASFVVDSKELK